MGHLRSPIQSGHQLIAHHRPLASEPVTDEHSNKAVCPRLQVLQAVTALDVGTARGRHAAWCGGVRPSFLSPEDAAQHGSVQVCRAAAWVLKFPIYIWRTARERSLPGCHRPLVRPVNQGFGVRIDIACLG